MLENLLCLIQHAKTFWGFDSEFLASGRINEPGDVHTLQFSDGRTSVVLESVNDLKLWLYNHHRIRVLYGFVVLPDLGSIEEWIPNSVTYRTRGSQTIGTISYRSFKAVAYDCRPLLQSFGIRKLADAGEIIGYPKLEKPSWLGLRKWNTVDEHRRFLRYAEADAVITSRIVQWLSRNFKADPQFHASAGTLARDAYALPERLNRIKNTVQLSPLEAKVKDACFAGRSEGFRTGYMKGVVYNDACSLYPVSLSTTHALEICGVEPCEPSELDLNSLSGSNYGWIEGCFETKNDLWGLPFRAKNNIYAVGRATGFYHTFDLCAAHARVLYAIRAFKPVFKRSVLHDKYVRATLDRVENRLKGTDKLFAKAVLNSLSGKLGQSHPVARTSNFYAYGTVLAHSHALMSELFARCLSEVLAMDTDSIFTYQDMTGKAFELDEGEYAIPVFIDAKGKGDLSFFRSKNYILKNSAKGNAVFARHGWCYFLEDFLKLADGSIEELQTRQDLKHTLLTRQREALEMAKGRWRTKPVTLTLEKIKSLLKADRKRQRVDFDSYGLVMQKRSEPSSAWSYDDLCAS